MLLFVALYYGNLSTKLTKTDSVTARPCVWHINSVAQKREEVSEMSSGPHSCHTAIKGVQWYVTGPENQERKGRREEDLSHFKKPWEREQMLKFGPPVPQDKHAGLL